MNFHFAKQPVLNRGVPSDSFLTQLVEWAKTAPDEIFAPRKDEPGTSDIFNQLRPILGTKTPDGRFVWDNLTHRKAALLEAMRVHAGFESSWNWNEGVDTTNQTSMRNIRGQETGAWQVSFDSTDIHNGAMKSFAQQNGIGTPEEFIKKMKNDHQLAMDYYGHLVRINTKWAGPILRHEFDRWLKRDAMAEFQVFLEGQS